jgi:tRNA-specific 2-thiouridylase
VKKRVVVGMSGGIDSSVAALLLKRAGHEVIGVTMLVYAGGEPGDTALAATSSAAAAPSAGFDSCYGPSEKEHAELAARVCAWLGMEHRTVDLRDEYRTFVTEYARAEYLAGRTPNPCIRCNQRVKFGLLLDKITALPDLGFDLFATGHYCRVQWSPERGRFVLRKGADATKDQSYFLCMLSQDQLARIAFPLGDHTKKEVRALGRDAGLPNQDLPESQDFATGGYRAHLGLGDREGPVVDVTGRRIGSHRGVWGFTIGQRKGIGVGGGPALYVTGIDAETNTVVAGPDEALYQREVLVREVNWVSREEPHRPIRCAAKIRYRNPEAPALLTPRGKGDISVLFDEPQRAVARGQWAVFYDGDILEGGGEIE